MKHYSALVCLVMGLSIGCSSEEDMADEPAMTEGTVQLSFAVTNGVRQNPNLVDDLQGNVYGALYRSFEVTVTGPIDGAEQYASIEMIDINLTSNEVSTQVWTSEALLEEEYTFLGFFDIDGNGADSRDPDAGDPTTLPVTNKFQITPGEEVQHTATFDLVL